MPTAIHYHNGHHAHSVFDVIPKQYRNDVKASLLIAVGMMALILFIMLGMS